MSFSLYISKHFEIFLTLTNNNLTLIFKLNNYAIYNGISVQIPIFSISFNSESFNMKLACNYDII